MDRVMKCYKAHIVPGSAFITVMKGDTLFGQMCWAIAHRDGDMVLRALLEGYTENSPFLVVSDPMAPGFLPKPTLPAVLSGEDPELKKLNRKKIWMSLDALRRGDYLEAVTAKTAKFEPREELSVHNAVNYKTSRTGDGFDPFGVEEIRYTPFEIYLLIDEECWSPESCRDTLRAVGEAGYGKKATTGRGRFDVVSFEEAELPCEGRDFMALAPMVVEGCDAVEIFYDTFVRFGKHGADDARPNPFKKPVLMAQTGALLRFESDAKRPFAGKGVGGISAKRPETVHQGYTPLVAIGVK